jgi:hypothetical protein
MFLFLKFSTKMLYILNMKQSKIFGKHEWQKQGGVCYNFLHTFGSVKVTRYLVWGGGSETFVVGVLCNKVLPWIIHGGFALGATPGKVQRSNHGT